MISFKKIEYSVFELFFLHFGCPVVSSSYWGIRTHPGYNWGQGFNSGRDVRMDKIWNGLAIAKDIVGIFDAMDLKLVKSTKNIDIKYLAICCWLLLATRNFAIVPHLGLYPAIYATGT